MKPTAGNSTGAAANTTTEPLLSSYGTDPTLEQEGVWSDEFKAGIEMKIRSSQSKEVKAAQARANKRSERFWKLRQDIPESIQRKNTIELACAAVADWRLRTGSGDTERVTSWVPLEGKQLECTEENKLRVFGDDRLWSLRIDVIAQMNAIDRFQAQSLEDDVKNSSAVSAIASPSETTQSAS